MAAVMGSATTARHFTAQRQDLGHWRLLQLDGKRVPLCEDRQTSSSDQPGGAVRSTGSLGGNRGDGSSGGANGVVLLQKQQRATAAKRATIEQVHGHVRRQLQVGSSLPQSMLPLLTATERQCKRPTELFGPIRGVPVADRASLSSKLLVVSVLGYRHISSTRIYRYI